MTQTIAEYFIQEGEKRGEKRGEERGEKRGELKAKREAILTLMQLRFDSVPEAMMKKVQSIRSLERLNALFEKTALVRSISEIDID